MHQDVIGARLREILDIALRLDDHQMHVERLLRRFSDALDDQGADGQVRHKTTVHDIDMDPVGAGLVDRPHLLIQSAEIRR